MRRKHFRLKRIALGLAVAAVVVPAAQAKPIASEISVQASVPQLGPAALVNAPANQPLGSGIQSPVNQLQVEGLRWQAMARAYQDRPGITAAGTAVANAKHSAYPVQATQTQAAVSGGFNWGDAGIGASVALGIGLMLLMAVVLGRRFRSRPTGLAST
jgi:hypothetical protein